MKNILKKIIPKSFYPLIRRLLAFINDFKFQIDALTFKKGLKELFYEKHGYRLNLKDPKSFSEKIICKKFYDRNRLLPVITDKYEVRHYIKKKLGSEAKQYLIPLYHITNKPSSLSFNWGKNWIIKPNHGWGSFVICYDANGIKKYIIRDLKEPFELEDTSGLKEIVLDLCNKWINTLYGIKRYAWANKYIKPLIMVEELLLDKEGNMPKDYKFYMFHGKCRLIHISSDRFEDLSSTYYDQDWNMLKIKRGRQQGPDIKKPKVLDKMIYICEKLSEDFDFIRVDLYLTDNHIYCGELTTSPGSGLKKITPMEFDLELGSYWDIKPGRA